MIVSNMQCAAANSICPLGADVYIGWPGLHGSNSGQFNAITQIEWLDRNVDRTYLHVYRCDPSGTFGIGRGRLQAYGNNAVPSSIIYPIFSAESSSIPNTIFQNQNDFLGDFLSDPFGPFNPQGGYTMGCAETEFQNLNDNTTGMGDNIIEGYAWFTYNLVNNINHPFQRKSNIANKKDKFIVNNQLNEVAITSEYDFTVQFVNTLGKIIILNKSNEGYFKINKSNLNPGIYILNVRNNSSELQMKICIVH